MSEAEAEWSGDGAYDAHDNDTDVREAVAVARAIRDDRIAYIANRCQRDALGIALVRVAESFFSVAAPPDEFRDTLLARGVEFGEACRITEMYFTLVGKEGLLA
jgi:hypothetical protein